MTSNLDMIKTYEAVIVGAGSAGLAAAYSLTQQGMSNLLIVDKHPPLSQTSAKSGENIRNWWPDPDMVGLMNRSFDLMERIAAETDNLINLERRGYLYISEKEPAEFDGYINHYSQLDIGGVRQRQGGPSEHADYFKSLPMGRGLSGADLLCNHDLIGAAFPHLSEKISVSVHARRAGSISVQQLGMFSLEQARKRGATFLSAELVGVSVDQAGVSGVELLVDGKRSHIETRCLINAAGPFAPQVGKMLGVTLPLYSVRQQKIAFQDVAGVVPRSAPFTIFMDGQQLEWTPEERADLASDEQFSWLLEPLPGGLHIKPEGGERGQWLKLGWAINRQPESPRWEPGLLPAFPEILLRGVSRCVPGLARYIDNAPQPLHHYAGYYTKTAENIPLIGPMPVKGSFVIGALSGFGSMASCAAGELLALWVTGGSLPPYASRFDPSSFGSEAGKQAELNNFQIGEL